VLGRLRAPGPAGCAVQCAALQLTARSVGQTERSGRAFLPIAALLAMLAWARQVR